jgi:beta-mannosidase
MRKRYEITDNWKFTVGEEKFFLPELKTWLPAIVPGTIHTDLLNSKIIEEPFFNNNELRQTWICESGWNYKTSFSYPKDFDRELPVFIIFEGLDTIADIYLNGSLLGKSRNMFLRYEFEVTSLLKDNNELEVRFQSPLKYAKEEEAKYGKLPAAPNPERVYIRKAQYSFGWDWGPSFPTSGIWKPVYLLQRNKSFIKNVSFSTTKLTDDKANVKICVNIESNISEKLKIKISLAYKGWRFEKETKPADKNKYEIKIAVNNYKLWWPNGEGEQNLYDLDVYLSDDQNNTIDYLSQKVGIRTVSLELVENENPTFKLKVNDKPIFAKGVNWIPADSFPSRVSPEKYRTLLQLAKEVNVNIVRVWGGGFYENDIFYQLCDELGLLVWQDFMFACAAYPEHDEFLRNVEEEVKQNVQRLRHHPSIALWCGNNENEWGWYQSTRSTYEKMPGYKIYHRIIPKILEEEDADKPYWPSSPFGFNEDPNSFASGNRHEWGIWSSWIDYSEVKNDNSLFVTEFGFQSPANKKTFEKFLSKEKRFTRDKIFEFHNKQIEGPERIFRFLAGHLPVKSDWDDYIYLAQLNQALALKTCLEHWRMNYPVTNGSIIWQLNDCWPVTSWSIVDSELLPKISYYFVKNIFKQKIISFKKEKDYVSIIGLNQTKDESEFILILQVFDDISGKAFLEKTVKKIIPSWDKREVHKIPFKDLLMDKGSTLIASLINNKSEVLFRNFFINDKWKYKTLPAPKINVEVKDEKSILVKTDIPAFFVDLFHPEIELSERGFIILPGEEKELNFLGNKKSVNKVNKDKLKIFTLNDYLQR